MDFSFRQRPSTGQSARSSLEAARSKDSKAPYLFIFLELFEQEGGIQSYGQCLLQSYLSLTEQPIAEIFLLRDGQGCVPDLYQSDRLKFRYFKTKIPFLGRLRLTVALLNHILKAKPLRVFCGHVNLAPLLWLICKPLGIPYTVMTHGKEVSFAVVLLSQSPVAGRPNLNGEPIQPRSGCPF